MSTRDGSVSISLALSIALAFKVMRKLRLFMVQLMLRGQKYPCRAQMVASERQIERGDADGLAVSLPHTCREYVAVRLGRKGTRGSRSERVGNKREREAAVQCAPKSHSFLTG